ncbi:MAG: DMT family transporter [Gaiellaceae bacterium]
MTGRTLAAFLAAVVVGGVNFVGVRYSNQELDPIWGAGLRFGLAAIVFGLLCAGLRLSLPRGRALALVVAYGLVGFGLAYGALYWALQDAPAGIGAVVLAIGPLLVLLLAVAHRLERFSVRAAVGAVVALAGSALMFLDPGEADVGWTSFALLGVAALAASESVVLSKLVGRQHPMAMNFVGMTAGSAALLVAAVVSGDELALPREGETQLAVAYLVLATVSLFLCILYVVQRWTASATAYTFVSMPVVAVIAGAIALDEEITAAVVAGGAIVLAGVYVGALSRDSTSRDSAHVPANSTATGQ